MCISLDLDEIKTTTEILAFAGAFLFFVFKLTSGFFFFNLSVGLKCERKANPATGADVLVVTAKLKKGDMSALALHDIQAKISYDSEAIYIPFEGFLRSSYSTDTSKGYKRRVAMIDVPSKSKPFLNFVPGEEASFACVTDVPRAATVRVDVVVLGKRYLIGTRVGEWRSSAIVPPGETAKPSVNEPEQ